MFLVVNFNHDQKIQAERLDVHCHKRPSVFRPTDGFLIGTLEPEIKTIVKREHPVLSIVSGELALFLLLSGGINVSNLPKQDTQMTNKGVNNNNFSYWSDRGTGTL